MDLNKRIVEGYEVRAALGDIESLTWIATAPSRSPAFRLATLLLLDKQPHPLAMLVAVACIKEPPDALRQAYLRCAAQALTMAAQKENADLLLALSRDGVVRAILMLATSDASDEEGWRAILAVADGRAGIASDILERLSAEQRRCMPHWARSRLVQISHASPWSAATAGVAAWREMTDDERKATALAAVEDETSLATLVTGVGVDAWRALPTTVQQSLATAMRSPIQAARIAAVAWSDLTEAEQAVWTESVARDAKAIARLIAAIGEDGWTATPDTVRAALLDALRRDPRAAMAHAACWPLMPADIQIAAAESIRDDAISAADAIETIGADGWAQTCPEARSTLLHAAMRFSGSAMRAAASVWGALTEAEQAMMVKVTDACDAEDFVLAVLSSSSLDVRAALVAEAQQDAYAAARVAAIGRFALTDDERIALINAAACAPDAAALLLERIGAPGFAHLSAPERTMLVASAAQSRTRAAVAGQSTWSALAPQERWTFIRAVENDPFAAASLLITTTEGAHEPDTSAMQAALINGIARICTAKQSAYDAYDIARLVHTLGEEGWRVVPHEVRLSLLSMIEGGGVAQAEGVSAVWRALDEEERKRAIAGLHDPSLIAKVMQRAGPDVWRALAPEAQHRMIAAMETDPSLFSAVADIIDLLDSRQRRALAKAVIRGHTAPLAVAQAVHDGKPLNEWMLACAPAADASEAEKSAWRPYERHLSQARDAGLPPNPSTRRRR